MVLITYMWSRGLIILLVLIQLSQQQRPCDPTTTKRVISVDENTPKDTKIGEFKFKGPDITTSGYEHEYLRYDPDNGNILSKKPINAETTLSVPDLIVTCKEANMGSPIEYDIIVTVKDVNEFAPKFEKDEYRVTITEAARVGMTVKETIVATDQDASKTTLITYSLLPGKDSEYFDIPVSTKGAVVVKKILELDKNIDITLTIKAQDNLGKDSTCKLIVSVVDLDDESPEFSQAAYTGTISASANLGDAVQMTDAISAVDGDKGLNAKVVYSLEASPGLKQYFSVEKQTGVIKLASFGINPGENHVVLVKAAQENAPTKRWATAQVVVTVQGQVNVDIQLAFIKQEYMAGIPENHPAGGDVLTVHAESSDKSAAVTYNIVQASTHPEFEIDSGSGRISLRANTKLDFEKTPKYDFQVMATVTGKDGQPAKQVTAKVIVNIININDNDPKFLQAKYNFKVTKASKGSKIGTVKATDEDGGQCKYSVQSYADVFAVSAVGDLTFKVDQKELKQGSYVFVVGCTDTALPPRMGTTLVDTLIGNGTAPVVSAGPSGEMDIIPLIVLAVLCGILLFIIIILVIYIQKRGAELKREKAHKQNISNLSIFGDSATNLNDDGATTVQENPLALENPGYFYMMKGDPDSSPTNDYLVSEVRYPDAAYYANGSTFTGPQNGSLPNRGGKRVKIQDKEDAANGQPADPKITVYF